MKKAAVPSILIAVVLLAFRVAVEAQQPKKVPRIGFLAPEFLAPGDPANQSTEAIRLALRELGYIEGQNIAIEYRYAEGKRDRYPELAAELVRLKVDIILVTGGDPGIRAAKNATKTIPIVMMGAGADPVEEGLIESLARPGGNVTGVTNLSRELGREATGAAQRSRSQTCPCRGSPRSSQSEPCTRAERGSDRRPSAGVDCSVLGGTSCGRFRAGIRCAEQRTPGWTLRARGPAHAC
jgi:ABC transporter substrate binding protein